MAVNPTLFVAAPMLQDYIVDKTTGTPLSNGIITLYRDNSRQTLKNWYYQTGVPNAYGYVPLDNPLHLSTSGTITDPNGNDVIPFFYPYNEDNEAIREPYYITVYSTDSEGNPNLLQFTRENFPFIPIENITPQITTQTLRNYIINNVYWRNVGPQNLTDVTDMVIAPSQHDGYTNGDIRFVKSVTGNNDSLTFFPFGGVTTQNDITPEYFLDMQCTTNTPGETEKCIRYPISLHLMTLQNQPFTIKLNASNRGGSPNSYLDIGIYRFTGTGALVSASTTILERINLIGAFRKYLIQGIFPPSPVQGNLGPGGDDAFFLVVRFPLSSVFHIGHTKPQIYLGDEVPDNDFDTYDQIAAVTNSPRTGDVRMALNTFTPFGWLPMNDGTLGNTGSNATTRANGDTWPLYNLLWNTFNPGLGLTSPYIEIYTAFANPPVQPYSANLTTFGATAIEDFKANKALSLTRMLGRVLTGTAVNLPNIIDFTTLNGNPTITRTSGTLDNIYNGMPVLVTLSNAVAEPFVGVTYYIKVLTANTFELYREPSLALANLVAPGANASATLRIPDYLLGQYFGLPYGVTGNTIYPTSGYPGTVTVGAASVGTRPPATYMNFYIKL